MNFENIPPKQKPDSSLLLIDLDQKLMSSESWSYKNKELLKLKNKVEALPETENNLNALWHYYHHGAQEILFKEKDKNKAIDFTDRAVEIVNKINHPNQITKLLQLLSYSKTEEVQQYLELINDDTELKSAHLIMKTYNDIYEK
jgi:hypothetical protein